MLLCHLQVLHFFWFLATIRISRFCRSICSAFKDGVRFYFPFEKYYTTKPLGYVSSVSRDRVGIKFSLGGGIRFYPGHSIFIPPIKHQSNCFYYFLEPNEQHKIFSKIIYSAVVLYTRVLFS